MKWVPNIKRSRTAPAKLLENADALIVSTRTPLVVRAPPFCIAELPEKVQAKSVTDSAVDSTAPPE